MKPQEQIGHWQLFALLFVSRVIGLFTFTVPQEAGFSAGDRTVFPLAFCLLCLLCAVPVLWAAGKHGQGLIGAARAASPLLARGVGAFYGAAFLCAAALGVLRFELFVGAVLFPESSTAVFTALLLAAAAAASLRGIQSLGRTAVILLALLAGSVLFLLIATADRFDLLNLTPPFEDGAAPVLKNAFRSAGRTMELASLAVAPAFTRGGVKKATVGWLTAFSVAACVIFLAIGGVTGLFGEQQMFPLYTLTAVAKFGVFERMDAALTGLWILGAFLQAAYFLWLSSLALEQGFERKIPPAGQFAGTAAVLGLFFLFSALANRTDGEATTYASAILFVLSVVVVPVAVGIVGRTKRSKEGRL